MAIQMHDGQPDLVRPRRSAWEERPRRSAAGVAKCVTGTARDGRDPTARVSPWAWDGVRQGRGLESSGTCVGVLITRRSQVQILPPLPTCQRYNRRSTARKLSLRAVFMCGEGVGRDQIRDQESSPVSRRASGRWRRIETNGPDWDGIGPARRRPPGRNPGGRTTSLRQGFIRLRLTQGGGNAHTCASHLDGSRAHYLHA